jgi:hypothetical protein
MIAALYVLPRESYYGVPDVDLWDISRDARLYAGPWSVVAHPPCARWGKYWSGGLTGRERMVLGEDGGCFESALMAVRKWGGVLEHPAHSHAWRRFDLTPPTPRDGRRRIGLEDGDAMWSKAITVTAQEKRRGFMCFVPRCHR